MQDVLKFAVPSGSLQERTMEILRAIGFMLFFKVGRDYRLGTSNGVEFLLRDREDIPHLVADGKFDAGITGSDLRVNAGVQRGYVDIVMDLPYSRASNGSTRWVLAAPGKIERPDIRIGTERMGLAAACLSDMLAAGAVLVKISGKEEAAVADGDCDAVFVVTESGSSLSAHGLTVVRDNLFVSSPQLLAAPGLSQKKRDVLEEVGLAMRAVLDAESMIAVTFDLHLLSLEQLILPAAVSPTISKTLKPDWIAGQVLIQRCQLGSVLRQLKLVGAVGVFQQSVQAYMKGGDSIL